MNKIFENNSSDRRTKMVRTTPDGDCYIKLTEQKKDHHFAKCSRLKRLF